MNFTTKFVPNHLPCEKSAIELLQNFINDSKKLFVLTGAGISTESGIPDYRSEGVGLYATSNRRPIQHQDFMKYDHVRQRYWARSFIAWPRFSSFEPNITHKILSRWESSSKLTYIATQNVDRLHQKAGSNAVIELHGALYEVECMKCSSFISREVYQKQMSDLNSHIVFHSDAIRPDGDVDLPEEAEKSFVVPNCDNCGGYLKPHVVFFGDNVPMKRVNRIKEVVASSDSFLVLGSSLSVYSSYRIILQAKKLGLPICIVNIGKTRADDLSMLKISARCGEVLPLVHIS